MDWLYNYLYLSIKICHSCFPIEYVIKLQIMALFLVSLVRKYIITKIVTWMYLLFPWNHSSQLFPLNHINDKVWLNQKWTKARVCRKCKCVCLLIEILVLNKHGIRKEICTYTKFDYHGVHYTTNDCNEVECVPWIFEEILQTERINHVWLDLFLNTIWNIPILLRHQCSKTTEERFL